MTRPARGSAGAVVVVGTTEVMVDVGGDVVVDAVVDGVVLVGAATVEPGLPVGVAHAARARTKASTETPMSPSSNTCEGYGGGAATPDPAQISGGGGRVAQATAHSSGRVTGDGLVISAR